MAMISSGDAHGDARLYVAALLGGLALAGCGGGGGASSSTDAVATGTDPTKAVVDQAQAVSSTPIVTCDAAGIGSAHLVSDLPTLPTTTPPNDSSASITSGGRRSGCSRPPA